jgi:transposase
MSRSGIGTKVHCAADAKGRPIDLRITAGNVHDVEEAEALIRGKETKYVLGDKGYDAVRVDKAIESIGAMPVIPVRASSFLRKRECPKEIYKHRSAIERFFSRLKGFRRVGTRYEKKGINFLNMVFVAAILIWLS